MRWLGFAQASNLLSPKAHHPLITQPIRPVRLRRAPRRIRTALAAYGAAAFPEGKRRADAEIAHASRRCFIPSLPRATNARWGEPRVRLRRREGGRERPPTTTRFGRSPGGCLPRRQAKGRRRDRSRESAGVSFADHNPNELITPGVAVSNPTTSSMPPSFGSAIVKPFEIMPTTTSLAAMPIDLRYSASACTG